MTTEAKYNQLIHSNNPYLLQHAKNPVNWQEWSKKILITARSENKLVFVSIGYSACHWCHVMEHDCFSQNTAAQILNDHFISIKVDREERPDLDHYYMDALQMMTGGGGWPLNMVCTPDGRPVHGFTYLNLEKFISTLNQLQQLWQKEPEKIYEFGTKMNHSLGQMHNQEPQITRLPEWVDIKAMWLEILSGADTGSGGYFNAPKFPMACTVGFGFVKEKEQYGALASHSYFTVLNWINGGIHDVVGGGFARYTVDQQWIIPHFEKMLYDNALMLEVLAKAHYYHKDSTIESAALQILYFLNTEMVLSQGGIASALDADSEGVEGKFYTWSYSELQKTLDQLSNEQFELFCRTHHITEDGNWEDGRNILYRKSTLSEWGKSEDLSLEELNSFWESCYEYLNQKRKNRIKPFLDDKVVTTWNALTLSALCKASFAFDINDFLDLAKKVANFLWSELVTDEKVFRTWREGKTGTDGFLEDYAALALAMVHMYQCTGNAEYLDKCEKVYQLIAQNFSVEEGKLIGLTTLETPGYFAKKETQDQVTPSSNALWAELNYTMATVFAHTEAKNNVEGLLGRMRESAVNFPQWHGQWGQLMVKYTTNFTTIVCTGPNAISNAKTLTEALAGHGIEVFPLTTPIERGVFKGKYHPEENYMYICQWGSCQSPEVELSKTIEKVKSQIFRQD